MCGFARLICSEAFGEPILGCDVTTKERSTQYSLSNNAVRDCFFESFIGILDFHSSP